MTFNKKKIGKKPADIR